MTKAELFYITEPSRGVFVVNIRTGEQVLWRFEISRDQLANFLVDGAGMALRTCQPGAGGPQPAPMPASTCAFEGAGTSFTGDA